MFCRKRDDVQKMIDLAVEAERGWGGDRRSKEVQGNDVTLKRGNNPTYALRRLKPDRPGLADKVAQKRKARRGTPASHW